MNGMQPSHEIRKLTIVLPAHVVDALRSQLRGDETVTDCIKRIVRQAADAHTYAIAAELEAAQ